MAHKVLIVDDEPAITKMFEDVLSPEPYTIMTAGSAEEALDILGRHQVDVIISDEKMPGMSGSELISVVQKKYPDTIRIILTGHPSVESAIRAINEGEVFRFFTKPCNVYDLAMTVRKALRQKGFMKESRRLAQKVGRRSAFFEEINEERPENFGGGKREEGEHPTDTEGGKTC